MSKNIGPIGLQEHAVTWYDQCLVWSNTEDEVDRFVCTDFGSMFYVWEYNSSKGMYYVVHKEFVATMPELNVYDVEPYRRFVKNYAAKLLQNNEPVFSQSSPLVITE
jgi:hypothetical protein